MKTKTKRRAPAYLPGEPVRSKRKSCSTSSRCNGPLCVRCCPDGYREPDPPADYRATETRRAIAAGLPGTTELEYPHRAGHGRCCAHHPVWNGLPEALNEIRAWQEEGGHTDAQALAELKRDKRYPAWLKQSRECLDQLDARIARRQLLFADGEQRQRAQARARVIREGGDVTGRAYRDTLKSAEGRRPKRPRTTAAPDPRGRR